MAQLAKVKRLTYDAGWMRWGWPERVGGLGGLDAAAGLPRRGPDRRATWSSRALLDDRGAGPDDDRLRPAGAGGHDGAARCCGATRRGARASPSPAPAATWPSLVVPGRRAPTTAGASPARRCGRAWPSTPSAACCSPAPARPSRPTGASPRCSSTWTRPGITVRPDRDHARRATSSARSSSTTSPSRSTARSATRARAGRWPWTCCPTSAAPRCGTGPPTCTAGSQQLLDAAPPGALDPVRARRGHPAPLRLPGPLAGHAAPAGRRRAPRRRRPRSTRCWWPRPSRRCSTWSADGAGRGRSPLGDDPTSDRWRTEFLYSRAATIYGGSAEIQRNIIARRLLDLGSDR